MRSLGSMSQRIVIAMTFAVFCFCFRVAECEKVSIDHPGLCNIDVVYKICDSQQFEAWTPYDKAVGNVQTDLVITKPVHAFDYHTPSQYSGVAAYGHAACDGQLTYRSGMRSLPAGC